MSKGKCPQCDEVAVTKFPHVEKFMYGGGDDAVELSANIEVSTCGACGFQFLDWKATEEMERVVQQHLKGEGS